MQPVHNIIYRGRGSKVRYANVEEWNFTSFLLASCLLYLNTLVSADQYNWNSNVPRGSYASLPAPVYNPAVASSQSKHAQPYPQNYNNHHLPYHQHHQPQQQQQSASISSLSSVASLAKSPSWYNSPSNGPRMGFYITDPTSFPSSSSPPSSSLLPVPSPTLQTLVASPRSLSSLASSSSPPPTLSTSNNGSIIMSNNATTNSSDSGSHKMKSRKKKKKKQRKTGKSIDATASSKKNAITSSSEVMAASPSNTELQTDAGTSRTFFITPLLAYLFPVFIAQMFGMGMIPAAALITLPIFLLPLGLTAAVFLV